MYLHNISNFRPNMSVMMEVPEIMSDTDTIIEGFKYPKKSQFSVKCPCIGCDTIWEKIKRRSLKAVMIEHILGKDHLDMIGIGQILDLDPKIETDLRKCLGELIIILRRNPTSDPENDQKKKDVTTKVEQYEKLHKDYIADKGQRQVKSVDQDDDEDDEDNKGDRIAKGRDFFVTTFNNADNKIGQFKSSRDIEKILNKFNILRAPVTEMLDVAFEAREDRDMYTGWSKADYEVFVEEHGTPQAIKVNHLALSSGPKNDSSEAPDGKRKSRFCQVDHVWEIQLISCAVQEVQRFKAHELSLSDIIKIYTTANDVKNLNATTGKVNVYKGKVMTNFKSSFQITSKRIKSIGEIIVENITYGRIFLKPLPAFTDEVKIESPTVANTAENQSPGGATNILNTIVVNNVAAKMELLMKEILEGFFFDEFFLAKDDDDEPIKGMKLLYGVLCVMFLEMFRIQPAGPDKLHTA
jgi:hypothetical protein